MEPYVVHWLDEIEHGHDHLTNQPVQVKPARLVKQNVAEKEPSASLTNSNEIKVEGDRTMLKITPASEGKKADYVYFIKPQDEWKSIGVQVSGRDIFWPLKDGQSSFAQRLVADLTSSLKSLLPDLNFIEEAAKKKEVTLRAKKTASSLSPSPSPSPSPSLPPPSAPSTMQKKRKLSINDPEFRCNHLHPNCLYHSSSSNDWPKMKQRISVTVRIPVVPIRGLSEILDEPDMVRFKR